MIDLLFLLFIIILQRFISITIFVFSIFINTITNVTIIITTIIVNNNNDNMKKNKKQKKQKISNIIIYHSLLSLL